MLYIPSDSPGRPEPRFDHHAPSATGVKELTQSDTGPYYVCKLYIAFELFWSSGNRPTKRLRPGE